MTLADPRGAACPTVLGLATGVPLAETMIGAAWIVGYQGDPANDVIFGLLGATVVVPALGGAVVWAWGFGSRKSE